MGNRWYLGTGEQSDIVVSTRIRLARNISEYPFPNKLNTKSRIELNNIIKDAMEKDNKYDLRFVEMKTLARFEAASMAERHIISPEFASDDNGRAFMISKDEDICIMLNEEDHIRLQVMKSGFALDEAYAIADEIDDVIGGKLNYAFDERIGYLTQCPTNLGTGMRASVMLHLPALTMNGQIHKLINTISKLGLTFRGAFGEGTKAVGEGLTEQLKNAEYVEKENYFVKKPFVVIFYDESQRGELSEKLGIEIKNDTYTYEQLRKGDTDSLPE